MSGNFNNFNGGFNHFNGNFSNNWHQGEAFCRNNFNHFNNFCWAGRNCFVGPCSNFWGWGCGLGWCGGLGFDLGFDYYPYLGPYCYDPAVYQTVGYNALALDTASIASEVNQAMPEEVPQPGADNQNNAGAMFFGQAEEAFQSGKYKDAVRLANHAAVESPNNPKAPELMSLGLFASQEYRGAAIQAHAALALGPPADWATLFGYYGELAPYTKQLRALEKYSDDNSKAPEAHFLLGYHYLMTGYKAPALKEFSEVVKLAPQDKLAAELVKQLGGDVKPAETPPPPKPAGMSEEKATSGPMGEDKLPKDGESVPAPVQTNKPKIPPQNFIQAPTSGDDAGPALSK